MRARRLEWWPSSHVMTAPNPLCIVWCTQHLLPCCHTMIFMQQKQVEYNERAAAHRILAENWGSCNVFVCMWQSAAACTKMNLPTLHTTSNTGIIPHRWLRTNGSKKHQLDLLGGHWRQGRGEEVNLGLTLNSQPVIVGSLKQPAALELERGHSWVSRPQWSAEQWGKDVCRLRFLLTEAALHWHQSKLTAVLLLCSVVCSEPNGLSIQANKEPWHAYRSRKWEF